MKKILLGSFFITLLFAFALHVQAQSSGSVQGSICSAQTNQPVPGLMVSLVHPQLGRSAAAYTDANGNFHLLGIPLRNDPYYIEVYWGQNLIYRNQVIVNGSVTLPRQCL